MNKFMPLFLAASVTLIACSDGSDPDTNPIVSIDPTLIEGVWIKPCGLDEAQDASSPDAYYDVVTVIFTGNQFSSEFKNYDDIDCTIPQSITPDITTSGTFEIGEQITTPSGPVATKFNLFVTEFRGRPINSTSYDIFYLSGGDIFFGLITDKNDASSEFTRPNDLDYIRVYSPQ